MIRINQLKLLPGHTDGEMEERIRKLLRPGEGQRFTWEIVKCSVDARKKPEIYLNYIVDVHMDGGPDLERRTAGRCKSGQVSLAEPVAYEFPAPGEKQPAGQPVIIGTGPAGLFCGYMLACHGYRPILLERGMDVESRVKAVEDFWRTGKLDTECNVQFGEGGAGTFSDGKLNTLVKDKYGRNRKVLDLFVEAGAPEAIRYEGKPHIGTDILTGVVKNMRKTIQSRGGEVRFSSKVTDIGIDHDAVVSVTVENTLNGETQKLKTGTVVLAIGHSARDTFEMLYRKKIPMEAKPFAVGLRVEHAQELIDRSQYGADAPACLLPASYKLTAQAGDGRSVYTFCMCPGGYVVNASSEEGRLAVNGMSYSKRDGVHANSAVVVSVTERDYGDGHPLAGMQFQRRLEENAWRVGRGKVPVEYYGEFKKNAGRRPGEGADTGEQKTHESHGTAPEETAKVNVGGTFGAGEDNGPQVKGQWRFSPVHEILPKSINRAFIEGMEQFGRKIKGFASDETLLSGIESRTSSPVRIVRDESGQSGIRGLYPCGEGAGYAGGITSAAMDGIRTAERIAEQYRPFS